MENCEPEIITFAKIGNVKLFGKIHSVIGGIRTTDLERLPHEQRMEMLSMIPRLYADRTRETLMGYYVK